MEFYQRVYDARNAILAEYADNSRKMAFVMKMNGNVLLAKMYPTSSQMEKFFYAVGIEVPMDALSGLIKCVGFLNKSVQESRVVVFEMENYRKQKRRMVVERDNEFGGWRVFWETEGLPKSDMVFAKEGEEMTADDRQLRGLPSTSPSVPDYAPSYIREFGQFYIKKDEDLKKMQNGLRSIMSAEKKTRAQKRKRAKVLVIDDDEEEEEEDPTNDGERTPDILPAIGEEVKFVNSHDGVWRISCEVLAKLFAVFKLRQPALTLSDCIFTYNSAINKGLVSDLQFNFVKYLMRGGDEIELMNLYNKLKFL